MAGEDELARAIQEWMGLAQELFTTADNYLLQISPDHSLRQLILRAVMCVDMVYIE